MPRMPTSSHCIAVVSLWAMNIEVRLFARDFNALKISASVVLSSALVASSHNLEITDQIHGISSKKKKNQLILFLYIWRSPLINILTKIVSYHIWPKLMMVKIFFSSLKYSPGSIFILKILKSSIFVPKNLKCTTFRPFGQSCYVSGTKIKPGWYFKDKNKTISFLSLKYSLGSIFVSKI